MIRLGLALLTCVACSSSKSKPPPPPLEAAARPAPSDAAIAQDEPEEDEEFEVQWHVEPFAADVDGDGAPEPIEFSCGETLTLAVGAARSSQPLSISELVGCEAALLTLQPGAARKFVIVTAQEHEEAGPPHHVIFSYDGTALVPVWSGDARLEFSPSGQWTAESGSCNADETQWQTTVQVMTWTGSAVATEVTESTSPAEPGACEEP